MDEEKIEMLLTALATALGAVAGQVQMSLEDGKIDFWEGIRIGATSLANFPAAVAVIKEFDEETIKELVMLTQTKKLVFM